MPLAAVSSALALVTFPQVGDLELGLPRKRDPDLSQL